MVRESKGRGLRGRAGRERVDDELAHTKARDEARKAKGNQPFRFWMPVGDTREVVIVDDEPWFFQYEHSLKDPSTGKWGLTMQCTRDYDNCPVCEATGKEGSYNMFLTVIDLAGYTDSRGNEHEYSRKLFVVKSSQQKKFIRRFEKDDTLRGAIFELSRDGNKSPGIGNDIEFMDFMEEDELLTYERSYKDRDDKRVVEKCHEPFDYEELMPEKTSEELEEEYNGIFGRDSTRASPGSSRDNDSEPVPKRRSRRKGRDDDDADDADDADDKDDVPFDTEDGEADASESKGRKRGGKSTRRSRRSSKDDASDDGDGSDDADGGDDNDGDDADGDAGDSKPKSSRRSSRNSSRQSRGSKSESTRKPAARRPVKRRGNR